MQNDKTKHVSRILKNIIMRFQKTRKKLGSATQKTN